MKVLLVQSNTSTIVGTVCPPFGIMYVGAVARENGHTVKIIDRNVDYFSIKKMIDFKPDILGISAMTGPTLKDGLLFSSKAKEIFGSNFPVVWGGVHPTLLPELTLNDPCVDYVIRGDGEFTFSELLNALNSGKNLEEVKGIGFKKDGKIYLTEEVEPVKNLDDLPMTPWDMVSAKAYLNVEIVLVTSRGCPFRCSFCISSVMNKKIWRSMSAERVIKEIENIAEITSNTHIKFHDDLMTVNKKRLFKILDLLPDKYSLLFYARVNHIDTSLLERLKKFPHVWLSFGVESGSQRILDLMNKKITVEKTREAFKLCKEYPNIHTKASVVLGSPTETREEMEMTLKLMKEINPTKHTYCTYMPYPGSVWYNQAVEMGLFKPPQTLRGWAELKILSLDKNRSLNIDKREIDRLFYYGWMKTIKNVITQMDWYKIYQRFRDYRPFLAKMLNKIEGTLL